MKPYSYTITIETVPKFNLRQFKDRFSELYEKYGIERYSYGCYKKATTEKHYSTLTCEEDFNVLEFYSKISCLAELEGVLGISLTLANGSLSHKKKKEEEIEHAERVLENRKKLEEERNRKKEEKRKLRLEKREKDKEKEKVKLESKIKN